jgi:NADH-quinone oxidoreductase subunit D
MNAVANDRPGPDPGRRGDPEAPGRQVRLVDAVTGAWAATGADAGGADAGGADAGGADAGGADAGGADAGGADAGGAGGGRAGAGPGEPGAGDLLINLGAFHPSGHGMLRLRLALDEDRVVTAEPVIGFMHRGAEKLFEVRDYRQIVVLANRHDWLGAFSSELGVVLAAERLAGIEVPPRGVWARTLLAELNRVLSHLAFLSAYPPEIAAAADGGGSCDSATAAAFRAREAMQGVMEEVSGGRMHFMFNRVGGLKEELPAGWLDRVHRVAGSVRSSLPLIGGVIGQDGFRDRTRGIGGLSGEQVRQHGVSGPAARGSGVDFDLRRDEPYLAYGELADVLRVITRQEGDCLARFECLLDQVGASLDLVDACASRLASLPRGPLSARLPQVFKVPEGEAYAWTENPLGLNGYFLVSRGGKTPWRLKLRSASFNNVAVLPEVLPGHRVADLAAVLGSLFFVVGDMDR